MDLHQLRIWQNVFTGEIICRTCCWQTVADFIATLSIDTFPWKLISLKKKQKLVFG